MILKGLVDGHDVGRLGRCGRECSEGECCKDRAKSERLPEPTRYHDLTLPLSRDGQFTPEIWRKVPQQDGPKKIARRSHDFGVVLLSHTIGPNVRLSH